jgi:Na+/H+-dicarboxylate symporter
MEGNLLGVSIFSLLFGYFTTKLPEKQFTIIFDFFTAILDVIMEITKFIIKFLPMGVFGLIGYTISQTGFHALYTAGIFFFFAFSGLLIYVVLFLVPLLLFEGISPLQHFKTVSPALITALSTSSSAATVPVTMESLEIDGGIPNRIVSFVIPLGTTVNLTAAAFYCSFTSLFLSFLFFLDLEWWLAFLQAA